MFWRWMYRTAQPSSAIQNRTASSVKVLREMWNRRSPPVMRSTTMYLISDGPISGDSRTGQVGGVKDEQVLDILEAVA